MSSIFRLLLFPQVDDKAVPNVAQVLAVTVGLTSLGLNLRTIHPGVGPTVDSIELQIAAWVGGIIHPPGSPQYLMLGNVIMRIFPGPTPAFRLNLFSALCVAMMVGVVYLMTYRLTRNLYVSGFASMALALAPRIWFQGSISELYALNGLYVASVFYFLIAWSQSHKAVHFWLATILYALSFGNHVSMILMLPAYIYIVSDVNVKQVFSPKNFAIISVLVLISALQYLYIPLRVATDPVFCNYCPGLLENPIAYVTGPFFDYITGGPFKGAMFGLTAREAMLRVPEAIGAFNRQFLPWGYMLGIIGAWELFRKNVPIAWMLVLGIVAQFMFVIGYDIPDWYDFLTPCYVLFAPLMGYAGLRIWEITEPLISTYTLRGYQVAEWAYPASLIVGMSFALFVAFVVHLPYVDQSAQSFFPQGTQAFFAEVESREADEVPYLLMPSALASPFYYSWAFQYESLVSNNPLQVIASPELVPPPGPRPAYIPWAEVSEQFSSTTLVDFINPEQGGSLFLVDNADPRAANWVLFPICIPESEQAAVYEVVAIKQEDGGLLPLTSQARWAELQQQITDFDALRCD